MVESARERKPLSSDPRLIPPTRLADQLLEAEVEAKGRSGWRGQQTTHVFLRAWAGLIEDIGDYRLHGSDDYQHSIGYRVMLHHLLMAVRDLGHGEALDWLLREVDRLDQIFLTRSTYDSESLILRRDKHHPAYWFLRRLPDDKNVIDHLRMIQPTDP